MKKVYIINMAGDRLVTAFSSLKLARDYAEHFAVKKHHAVSIEWLNEYNAKWGDSDDQRFGIEEYWII